MMASEILPLPQGMCDCHVHLIGPHTRYPFAQQRVYTPGDADEVALNALHHRLGVARVVIVQPSVYGTDNRRMLDGLKALGRRARGVAVIEPVIDDASLGALHAAGVRGVRVNIATSGMDDPSEAWRRIKAQADRVTRLGWHVKVLTRMPVIAALAERIASLPCPLVIDHFGLPDLDKGPGDSAFRILIDLVRAGHAMVKLSAMQRLTEAGKLDVLRPFIQALAEANPAGILWGSDWPHTGGGRDKGRPMNEIEPFQAMDDRDALIEIFAALPNPATRQALFTINPARLYGFEEGDTP